MVFTLTVDTSQVEAGLTQTQKVTAKVEKEAEMTRKQILSLTLQQISSTWGMIDRVTGASKTALGAIISGGISILTQVISLAYATAAMYAGIPGGQALAVMQVGNAVAMTGIQVMMQAMNWDSRINRTLAADELSGYLL